MRLYQSVHSKVVQQNLTVHYLLQPGEVVALHGELKAYPFDEGSAQSVEYSVDRTYVV